MILLPASLLLAAGFGLVGLGLYALTTRRHLLRVLVGLQIMAKGTLLALLAAGQYSGQIDLVQTLIITVIVADTVVATAALAIAVRVWRRLGTLDLATLAKLKG
jgi:NADH:ubiquinone oxidoreductase subunit K